ncbi:MAG: hypothetical protein IKP24_02170 [Alphaproteobacteria bacterium]|nr:hypothetical protein [Alphaproteobacteria bacterium]
MAKILEYIDRAKEIADSLDNVALKSIILDLQGELLQLQQDNLELKQMLRNQEDYRMEFFNDVYWNVLSNGEKDGPFCSACWDKDKKAVRLHEIFLGVVGRSNFPNSYKCPICGTCVSKKRF